MKTTRRVKLNVIPIAIITAMFAVSNASSAKDCAQVEVAIDIADCHVAEYKAADKELNAVYNEAQKTRPAKEKQKLKAAQQAWLHYRDASIAFMVETHQDAGSYGNIAVADYQKKLTQKRVQELKVILSGPESPAVEW
jgi:uncharacterized protein YecT (DUF1311 family)